MKQHVRSRPGIATTCALASVTLHCVPSWAGDLELAINFEKASESHYVAIANNSPSFLCVAESVFDTRRGRISLSSLDGQPTPRRSYADSAPNLYRGVDLAQAYLMLRPGEHRKIYIDLTNFATEEGTYQYNIVFPYYVCKDIIETGSPTTRRDVTPQAAQASGTLTIPSKGR